MVDINKLLKEEERISKLLDADKHSTEILQSEEKRRKLEERAAGLDGLTRREGQIDKLLLHEDRRSRFRELGIPADNWKHLNETLAENTRIQSELFRSALPPIRDLISPLAASAAINGTWLESSSFAESIGLINRGLEKSLISNFAALTEPATSAFRELITDNFANLAREFSRPIRENFEQLHDSLLNPYLSRNSDLINQMGQMASAAALTSIGTFADALSHSKLLADEKLMFQLSGSVLDFERFSRETLSRLDRDLGKAIAPALEGSLKLANEQLIRSTALFETYVDNAFDLGEAGIENSFEQFTPNRLRVQRRELVARKDIVPNEEYESLLTKSPTAETFEKVVRCMTLIGLCNDASQTVTGQPIFSYTTTLWISGWKLPAIIPTNRSSFGEIIDSFYLLLYEAAGKDKLRFLVEHGGVLEREEAEIVWKIKHLRNKWLRHDIEHGSQAGIQKSYRERREALQWFGVGGVPQTKSDYLTLYQELISKVETFLSLLLTRISQFTQSH